MAPPDGMNYKSFRSWYFKEHGGNVGDFIAAWRDYKGGVRPDAAQHARQDDPPGAVEPEPVVEQPTPSPIEVAPAPRDVGQSDEEITVSQPTRPMIRVAPEGEAPEAVQDAPAQLSTVAQPPGPPSDPAEYERLAKRIHRGAAGLLSMQTDGAVKVEEEELRDLDEAGARLVKKYDVKGKLLEWAPEIVYVLTLLWVGMKATTQYLSWKKKQEAPVQAAQVQAEELRKPISQEAAYRDGVVA